MKNHQTPTGRLISDGETIQVHSIFPTIQGEGPFAGTPATFIRLAHCNLQCPGCDTEYTAGAVEMRVSEIVTKVSPDVPLVVITGGEPLRQNISKLCADLCYCGINVQIETNGMLPMQHLNRVIDYLRDGKLHLVVSPKTHKLHYWVAAAATAYKYVVSAGATAPDGLPIQTLDHPVPLGKTIARPPHLWEGPIFVQPADTYDSWNDAHMEQAVASVLMDPRRRRLCLQTHKYARLP